MIKYFLFDADGVVIKKRTKPFSVRFSEDYGVSADLVSEFYKNEYQLCAVGKADLKTAIVKYLSRWNWTKSVDELLEYWFDAERELDNNVVSLIKN